MSRGAAVALSVVMEHLDAFLRVAEVPDYPVAYNGLQVASSGWVRRVALAVDAAQATIDRAVELDADLLIVHHGLFWDGDPRVTDRRYRRLKALLDADLALYSAHLPLDVHPQVGNNAVLARALGLQADSTFAEYRGHPLGVAGPLEGEIEALQERLEGVLGGPVQLIAGGPDRTKRVGIITGGAGGEVKAAVAAGIDTFITGEGAHHNFFDAEEGGVNLLLGGHYATEIWGVQALGDHLAERFGLPCTFIDHPTGL